VLNAPGTDANVSPLTVVRNPPQLERHLPDRLSRRPTDDTPTTRLGRW